MVNTIDKELIYYFVQLNETQKKSLLQMIKSFLNINNNSSDRIDVMQYNRELEEAMKRIDDGAFTTLETLEKEMETW